MPKKGKEPAGLRRWRLAHRRKGKSHRSARSSGGNNAPGFAAMYQQGKTAAQVLSPVTDDAIAALSEGNTRGAWADLQQKFTNPGHRTPYLKGLVVTILDAWGSRKIRHANALAKKSVTAAAPEVYALGTAILDNDFDPRATHQDFIATTSGYDPYNASFSTRGRLRTYLALKYGGKAVRIAAKAIPAAGRPIKKALNMLGLTL